MKNKIVPAIVVLFLSMFSYAYAEEARKKSAPIYVAALLPLTGSGASQGEWSRQGFELARQELLAESGTDIQVLYEDTKGDPKLAVEALNHVLGQHPLAAVFTWGSGVGLALTPIVNEKKIIQMGIATGTQKYRTEGDYTFRNFHSALDEAHYIADFIKRTYDKQRVALLWINNDYGVGIGEAVRDDLAQSNVQTVFADAVQPGSSDFRTELLRVRTKNPSVLFFAVYPTEGAVLLRQAREIGIKVPVIAAGAILGGKEFFDLVGDNAEGMKIVVPEVGTTPQSKETLEKFVAAYRKQFGDPITELNYYSAKSYDAMKLVGQVAKRCASGDNTCIRDRLFQVRNFPGASGEISFDSCGDISSTLGMLEVRGASFAKVTGR